MTLLALLAACSPSTAPPPPGETGAPTEVPPVATVPGDTAQSTDTALPPTDTGEPLPWTRYSFTFGVTVGPDQRVLQATDVDGRTLPNTLDLVLGDDQWLGDPEDPVHACRVSIPLDRSHISTANLLDYWEALPPDDAALTEDCEPIFGIAAGPVAGPAAGPVAVGIAGLSPFSLQTLYEYYGYATEDVKATFGGAYLADPLVAGARSDLLLSTARALDGTVVTDEVIPPDAVPTDVGVTPGRYDVRTIATFTLVF